MNRLLGSAAAFAVQEWDKVEKSPDWASVSADRLVNLRALGIRAMAAKEKEASKQSALPAGLETRPPDRVEEEKEGCVLQ